MADMVDMVDIQKVIDCIKRSKNVRSEKDIAPLLGLTAADFSNRKKRGTLIPLILEWAIQDHFDLNVLFTGKCPESEINKEGEYINLNRSCIHTMDSQRGPNHWLSEISVNEIKLLEDFSKDAILVKMTGTSMEPTIHDGAIFAIDKDVAGFTSGQVFVVWIPFDGPVVRRVFVDLEKLILKADNQAYPDITIPICEIPKEDLILGRVKWVLQSL